MNKDELASGLANEFENMIAWYKAQSSDEFETGPAGKWTAAQHLDHLIRSAKPVNQALRLPKLALGTMFGKADRDSLSFDGVVGVYKEKLAAGGAASGRFVPEDSVGVDKNSFLDSLRKEGERLVSITNKWKEADLDIYQLPHPLIGNMTVREMLQFTIYHMQHHLNALSNDY